MAEPQQTSKALRIGRHFLMTRWHLHRVFPPATLQAIGDAIKRVEASHGGELRFVIEAELSTAELFRNVSPRARAVQLFGELGIWDTADNNGVLIYVLLADRDVEIVTDRGYVGRVTDEEWTEVCRGIEAAFRAGDYYRGSIAGIDAASKLMAWCYPTPDRNELSDAPVIV